MPYSSACPPRHRPAACASGVLSKRRAAQRCATGFYLLPDSADSAATLGEVAAQAVEVGGSGQVYRLSGCDEAQKAALRALFDRGEEYASIAEEIKALGRNLASPDGADAMRKLQPLVRRFEQVNRIDFFPGEAQRQTLSLLDDLRDAITRRMSPDEPTARQTDIPRLNRADYQGRTWATRARPWVDRLASAWLIRRFIDPSARIVWLASPSDCRNGWLGFDFDGAAFSHVGTKVTFETLLASFGLDSAPALVRLGKLVHCLDLGGLPVAEALGIESLLAGLRASEPDDDALLARACEIFDWLLKSYEDKTT
ncbi:chromate resistance protein ChrB domain-containing protein [Pseudomonas aeruginosa]